jgi:hypothetical protein
MQGCCDSGLCQEAGHGRLLYRRTQATCAAVRWPPRVATGDQAGLQCHRKARKEQASPVLSATELEGHMSPVFPVAVGVRNHGTHILLSSRTPHHFSSKTPPPVPLPPKDLRPPVRWLPNKTPLVTIPQGRASRYDGVPPQPHLVLAAQASGWP